MFQDLTNELDSIAGVLEKRGDRRTAAAIDAISNSLENFSKRTAGDRTAISNSEMVFKGKGKEESPPPGSDDAMEYEHDDAFVAEPNTYHRFPTGKQSMSEFVGAPSPVQIPLDIAEEGSVNIQASRRQPKPQPTAGRVRFFDDGQRTAAESATEGLKQYSEEIGDITDPLDPWTTEGMEPKQTPPDEDQKGGKLQFFGNEPAGSIHMPDKVQADTNAEVTSSRARQARDILQRAAKVDTFEPTEEGFGDESMNHIDPSYMEGKNSPTDSDLHRKAGSEDQDLSKGPNHIDEQVESFFDVDSNWHEPDEIDVPADHAKQQTDFGSPAGMYASGRQATRKPGKIRFRP